MGVWFSWTADRPVSQARLAAALDGKTKLHRKREACSPVHREKDWHIKADGKHKIVQLPSWHPQVGCRCCWAWGPESARVGRGSRLARPLLLRGHWGH